MVIDFDAPYGLSMDECLDVIKAYNEYNKQSEVLDVLKDFAFFNKFSEEGQRNFFDAVMCDLKNTKGLYIWSRHEIERAAELVAIRRGIEFRKDGDK